MKHIKKFNESEESFNVNLEEAAENYAIDKQNDTVSKYYIALESFISGAKWNKNSGSSDESKTYTKDEVINLIFDYQKKELGKINSNTDEEWNFTDPNGYNYVSLDRIKSKIVQFMDDK
jgi:hypothetical protein